MKKNYILSSIIAATSLVSIDEAAASVLLPNSIYRMTLDPSTSYIDMIGSYTMQDTAITDPSLMNPLNSGGNGVLDGHAGVIEFQTDATGDQLTVNSFQIDPIGDTFGGVLFQYADSTAAMSGEFTSPDAMEFQFTGRKAVLSGFATSLGEMPFNVDAITGLHQIFTTGTACNSLGCITGSAVAESLTNPGEFTATLVSAGTLGEAWFVPGNDNPGEQGNFDGTDYFEVWSSQNTITYVGSASVVPIPAAVWLFGSGLLGLIGVARRKA